MTQFNPLAPAILVGQTLAHRQDAEKVSQVKHAQAQAKNVAATSDRYEHTVESTEPLAKSHEDKQKKNPKQPLASDEYTVDEDEPPHLDVTA
jgi:hypothetical protein